MTNMTKMPERLTDNNVAQPVTEHPVVKQVEQALEDFKNGDVIREKYVTFTVTDEARAKALKDLTDLWPKGTGFVKDWTEGMFLERHYETIKAALSQPVPQPLDMRNLVQQIKDYIHTEGEGFYDDDFEDLSEIITDAIKHLAATGRLRGV